MQRGEFSDEQLKRALECLRQGKPLPDAGDGPIETIEEAIAPVRRGPADTREHALLAGLRAIVLDRLMLARNAPAAGQGTEWPNARAEAGALIADFHAGDRVREAWSAVYHRYFAPDAVQVQQIAALTQADPAQGRRKVHRRTRQGIQLLADVLRDRVAAARAGAACATSGVGGAAIANTPPHNLPARRHPSFGRARLAVELRDLLEQSPLVTLVGPPGVGKSHLALQVAGSIVERFPDGVWWVDLAPVERSSQVPEAVAQVLGVRDLSGRSTTGALIAHLRPRGLLLCLDNCTLALDACASLIASIIAACPNIRVLATGRERLRIEGECLRRVMPLALPAATDGPASEADWHNASVQLFIDRARCHRSSFALDPDDLDLVGQIVRRLDGVPLAIETVARGVGSLGLRQIAARLADPDALLSLACPASRPHQPTLRAAVARSYDRLDPDERFLFDRASTLAGRFTVDDPDPLAGRRMCGLVEKSLVLAERDAAGPWSYLVIEPCRAFGRTRWAARGMGKGFVSP